MTSTHCPICHVDIPRHMAAVRSTCGKIECRIQLQRQRSRQRSRDDRRYDERRQQLVQLASELRDQLGIHARLPETSTYQVVTTPANTRKISRLPRRRMYRFAKRLWLTLSQVSQDSGLEETGSCDPGDQVPFHQTTAAACCNCRGKCCVRGGTDAYLDTTTLSRYLSFSNVSPRLAFERYIRHLPRNTFEGSCVFHTATGCALPREMRSRTCNRTICGGIVELNARNQIDGQTRFFLAAATSDRIVRSRFVDQHAARQDPPNEDATANHKMPAR